MKVEGAHTKRAVIPRANVHELSARVSRLPKFRGIPVPFFVTYRRDGSPDFKVINEKHRKKCATDHLCWICGERLDYWVVFIGGPRSAAARMYVDGPMHEECARDALALCPFLVGRMDYAKDLDLSKHPPGTPPRVIRESDATPPEQLILFKTRAFKAVQPRGAESWMFLAAPAVHTETLNRSR